MTLSRNRHAEDRANLVLAGGEARQLPRIPEFYRWECSVMARRASGLVMMMVDAVKSTGRFVGLDAFVPLAVAVGTV